MPEPMIRQDSSSFLVNVTAYLNPLRRDDEKLLPVKKYKKEKLLYKKTQICTSLLFIDSSTVAVPVLLWS